MPSQSSNADRYPLTRTQTWVWTGQRLLPGSPLNNMAFAFTWRRAIDPELFRQACQALVERFDALHLVFGERDGEPEQTFAVPPSAALSYFDCSAAADPAGLLATWLDERCQRVFSPGEHLFDLALLKVAEDHYVWYFNQHHLITDGWSLALQFRYVEAAYAALAAGLPLPEGDFSSFRRYLEADALAATTPEREKTTAYWAEKARELPTPPLLFGRGNPERASRTLRYLRTLDAATMARLDAVCATPEVRNWSVDLARYTVFATVLFALLHRISGGARPCIGVPAHHRLSAADKKTPGLLMELFPQSVQISPEDTFASLLAKVRAETMEWLRYAKPGTSSAQLNQRFNVLFNYLNQALVGEGDPALEAEWLHPGHTEPGHHLKFQVFDFEGKGRLDLCFDCNDAIIDPALQRLLPQQYLDLLEDFLADRSLPVNFPSTCGRALLDTFNPVDPSLLGEDTVLDFFYASVDYHPARTAVVAEATSLTFAALDERSNRLANYLLALQLPPETPVAICLDRSVEMMVGLLGILKAGAAYVPIDPTYPALRIRYLLEDTAAPVLLTQERYAATLRPLHEGELVLLDAAPPVFADHPAGRPILRPGPDQLMYIIHTSGSTGQPKGVRNRYRGVMNRLRFGLRAFPVSADSDVLLQKTTYCFDVSIWELFWPLMTGMKLVFAKPEGHKDNQYLAALIRREGITIAHFVPPMLEAFLGGPLELPSLRRVFCSGEALTPHQVNLFRSRLPGVELHNLYGPTEASIEVTHWRAPAAGPALTQVPIGRPLPNVPLYILGPDGVRCEPGVPGELHIGGLQVALGYHGKPELTAEKFVRVAIDGRGTPQRLYRTGDLARWLPDGNIDFLGRIDSQIKLRGFRVELGEIEAVLLTLPGVTRAQVLARQEGHDAYLVAYVVADDFSADGAQAFLAERLPAYMVPGHYMVLADFPLNSNGKIDRAALPAPVLVGGAGEATAPANELEGIILQLWRDTLGLEDIGVTTSFHDLGGHSLSAIRLINQINDALELDLPANTIFRFPTVRSLAAHTEAVIRSLLDAMNEE
ncbi:non-ribosomal peptide synthetase [Neolewinella lacunae]|uniref:Amino acid adenylation domain-containing protein n=1 Tax=Neolewinella lacunae TaxID=1517758 RepID=A0A923PK22_9BACT|nr:non-ribosomal peptide synthetase [Neolewinella lacunae]MBC6994131.1 amino acid adenylation domain-containing protein [Neolewinella lacunae]MDN3636720.1 non-ribosomal peptide synthetase [Neolewinella lacunae]